MLWNHCKLLKFFKYSLSRRLDVLPVMQQTPHWLWWKHAGVFFLFWDLCWAKDESRRKLVLPLVWKERSYTWSAARSTLLTCLLWAILKLELTALTPPGSRFPALYRASTMHSWKKQGAAVGSDKHVHVPWKHTPTQDLGNNISTRRRLTSRQGAPPLPQPLCSPQHRWRGKKRTKRRRNASNQTNRRCTSKALQHQTDTAQFRCI